MKKKNQNKKKKVSRVGYKRGLARPVNITPEMSKTLLSFALGSIIMDVVSKHPNISITIGDDNGDDEQ